MARPAKPPFTLGKITYKPHPTMTGHVQARGYYNRPAHGANVTEEVTASGKTEAAARRALQGKVADAQKLHQGGDKTLNQNTKVRDAVKVWLDDNDRRELSASTRQQYADNARRYVLAYPVANATLSAVNTVNVLATWLAEIADEHGEGAAKSARKIMGGVLGIAESRDAIAVSVMSRVKLPRAKAGSAGAERKCRDSECDYDCGRLHNDTKRALTRQELQSIMAVADSRDSDVADVIAFLFGTGARIAEALHCVQWADVDLDLATVRIRGTKTAAADRTVVLSDELVERLRERAALWGTTGLVFGTTRFESKLGQPRDPRNVQRAIRSVLDESECQWAGTHTFRRTVATWMDEAGSPLAEIANQLGHANINVTTGYLGRKVAPTRAAKVMTLAPETPKLELVAG